jgi:hypothetical protein
LFCFVSLLETQRRQNVFGVNKEGIYFMTSSIFRAMTGAMIAMTAATVASTVASTAAADEIQLGVPAYGGAGCPAGTASASLSPDAKTLSILFDQYLVEAGASTNRTLDRKGCNLAIPVHVPHGFSVAVFQVDYRGFAAIPAGGRGQFNVEYFFAGSQGPRQAKTFFGPSSQNYNLTSNLESAQVVWSPCGADTNLRVNTSMLVQTNAAKEEALASVDSADITAGIVYQIQWRTCN